MLTRLSDFVPESKRGSGGFIIEYTCKKSDASSHQVGKGHGDRVSVGVADKNGQAGGGLVYYFSDQAAKQERKYSDPDPVAKSYLSFDEKGPSAVSKGHNPVRTVHRRS